MYARAKESAHECVHVPRHCVCVYIRTCAHMGVHVLSLSFAARRINTIDLPPGPGTPVSTLWGARRSPTEISVHTWNCIIQNNITLALGEPVSRSRLLEHHAGRHPEGVGPAELRRYGQDIVSANESPLEILQCDGRLASKHCPSRPPECISQRASLSRTK